ncbi:MAG: cupin domain-containing protein, partial [Spirochaetaceae bacterium]|nr:cupin domain-containing protein [Spirochaetaceae bacterium]
MNRTNFEQVQYDSPSDVKPIITNLVHTYPHWHNEIEIVFACRGELLLEIGSRKMILKEGEIAVVNSTETHAVNTHKKETGEKNGDNNLLLMLQLSRQFMRNLYADSNKIRFCETITANEETEKTGLSLSNLLLCIMREAQADYENRPAVIHGLCGAVAAILIRYFSETDPVPDLKLPAGKRERSNHVKSEKDDEFDRNAERFKRILIFVNEHYAENPSLSDVA